MRKTRLYGTAAVIRFLLLKINPTTAWPLRLKGILSTLPAAPGISMSHAGFPVGWDALPLWTIANNAASHDGCPY
jgi:hypothetical protein